MSSHDDTTIRHVTYSNLTPITKPSSEILKYGTVVGYGYYNGHLGRRVSGKWVAYHLLDGREILYKQGVGWLEKIDPIVTYLTRKTFKELHAT